jgi:hypothetical protein
MMTLQSSDKKNLEELSWKSFPEKRERKFSLGRSPIFKKEINQILPVYTITINS